MDWTNCTKAFLAKSMKPDTHKIASLMEIAGIKLKTAKVLGDEHYYGKFSLLYDILRELLECLAIHEGYKIYNHECYTAFLKEVIRASVLGDHFDKLRKLRNGINYYGKKISQEEGIQAINQACQCIGEIKALLQKGGVENA